MERKHIEIDIIDYLQKLKEKWKFILMMGIIFFVIGVVVALMWKEEYTTSCKLLPEFAKENNNLGQLGSLADIAGFNMNTPGETNSFSPTIYPEIVNSTSFQNNLMNDTIKVQSLDTLVTSYVYLTALDPPSILNAIAEFTIRLPGKIRGVFKGEVSESETVSFTNEDEIIFISKEQKRFIEQFKRRVTINTDNENGLIVITVKMPDPVAAATLARSVVKLLTEEIITHKIQKAKDNLNFIDTLHQEAEQKFIQKQREVAAFNDRNLNVISSLASARGKRLEYEYDLAFSMYKELSSRLEQAKVKVKEQTPVFSTVEAIVVPVEKSEPKRTVLVIVFLMLGGLIGIAIVTYRYFMSVFFGKGKVFSQKRAVSKSVN